MYYKLWLRVGLRLLFGLSVPCVTKGYYGGFRWSPPRSRITGHSLRLISASALTHAHKKERLSKKNIRTKSQASSRATHSCTQKSQGYTKQHQNKTPSLRTTSQITIPAETEILSECLVPNCGISTAMSDRSTTCWSTPYISWPKTKAYF